MKPMNSSSSKALSSLLQGTSFLRSKNREGAKSISKPDESKKRARTSLDVIKNDINEEEDDEDEDNGGDIMDNHGGDDDRDVDDDEPSPSLSLFSNKGKKSQSTTISSSTSTSSSSTSTYLDRRQQHLKESRIKNGAILAAEAAMQLFRKKMGIRVLGESAPNAFSAFNELPLHINTKVILKNIEASRYKEPTAIQMQAIPSLLMRRDILACAPTGTGKTAAFMIPILSVLSSTTTLTTTSSSSSFYSTSSSATSSIATSSAYSAHTKMSIKRGVRALIVVPTTELAQQTKRAAEALGGGLNLRTALLCRAQVKRALKKQKVVKVEEEEEDEEDIEEEENSSDRKGDYSTLSSSFPQADILVCTPKRLSNMLRRSRSRSGAVCFPESLLFLIFDEADRLLEPDSPTRSYMDAVIDAAHSTSAARTASSPRLVFGMFTATVSTGIEDLANSVLDNPLRVFVGARGAAASSIKQSLLFVGKEEGKLIALKNMVSSGVKTPALVFVQSKSRGEDVKNALADQVGVDGAGLLHGDLSSTEQNSVVQRVRRGTILFLVATDLAARGLDFPGVKTVINFDFPTTGVQYIHRIGRTGRGGRSGEAVTFFVENDIRLLRTIANVMRISGCDVPEWMLTLKKLERKAQKKLQKRAVKRGSFNGSLHGSER